jgi:hypothetical protein
MVADAALAGVALGAWKYLTKKKGGYRSHRKLPTRHGLTGRRSHAR